MTTRLILAVALALASGMAAAATDECVAQCERTYKSCVGAGKMTENQCRMALEKCRKTCGKKKASTG